MSTSVVPACPGAFRSDKSSMSPGTAPPISTAFSARCPSAAKISPTTRCARRVTSDPYADLVFTSRPLLYAPTAPRNWILQQLLRDINLPPPPVAEIYEQLRRIHDCHPTAVLRELQNPGI